MEREKNIQLKNKFRKFIALIYQDLLYSYIIYDGVRLAKKKRPWKQNRGLINRSMQMEPLD